VYPPYGPPPALGFPPWWGFPPFALPPAGPPKTAKPIVAGLVWCLLMVRHLGFLAIVAILLMESGGRPFPPGTLISPIAEPLTLMLIVTAGLAASVVALVCDFSRSNYAVGTWAGAVALAASLTPGVLFGFGLVGTALGCMGLALHYASRREFAKRPAMAPAGPGAFP